MTADMCSPCTTVEAARLLGLAVRSVQSMVDRGELDAWKTPGGHRRISRASVERWLTARRLPETPLADASAQVLLIEDSVHCQNLVSLLMRERFADLQLHTASDGITGLAMYGALRPDLLIVDIVLPGIDGVALLTALRSQPQFAQSRLLVLTGLDVPGAVERRLAETLRHFGWHRAGSPARVMSFSYTCLLYTSDAADE